MLVVDDDKATRELIARGLQKEGFRVLAAASGEEALRLAREKRPDVISLDVLMPGMDGWTVLRALKGDPLTSSIPVVMVSMLDDRDIGYALGAADYLTKPFDREKLVLALRRFRQGSSPRPVLVVEDDPATREVVRRALERDGWIVSEADNGRRALESLSRSVPDLIVLDLMMPEMDGFEFVAELRRIGGRAAHPGGGGDGQGDHGGGPRAPQRAGPADLPARGRSRARSSPPSCAAPSTPAAGGRPAPPAQARRARRVDLGEELREVDRLRVVVVAAGGERLLAVARPSRGR